MSVLVLRADARELPLPDACADLIVTSPPYFGLRSYTDGGEHYAGQVGSEATPAAYIDALVACTREWVRVLKPSGSLFINLGDKYSSGGRGTYDRDDKGINGSAGSGERGAAVRPQDGFQPKSLLGLPWRYALAVTDQLGLILRAEIIWAKPNGLPESVTDRVRRAHEQVFHFTVRPRYYSAVDEIREPQAFPNHGQLGKDPRGQKWIDAPGGHEGELHHVARPSVRALHPLGKLPGSVWSIDYNEDESLIRSILRAHAAGALTIDEAERLITGGPAWTGSNGSRHASTAQTTAGTGSAPSMTKATDTTESPTSGSEPSIGSHTNSGSDPFPPDSPSTTFAATDGASTQRTSSQSPSARTSDADARPPSEPASTAMSSLTQTPMSDLAAAGNAGPACENEHGLTDTVWSIPSQPLTVPPALGVDHFAAFPMELPRRLILGWSPPGVCTGCGEGRRPVPDRELTANRKGRQSQRESCTTITGGTAHQTLGWERVVTITGYACACPQPAVPTRPAVVLDPFGGTGTTALLAHVNGRHGITIDRSADYCRIAAWRTSDRREIAAAMQVPRPEPVSDLQEALWA